MTTRAFSGRTIMKKAQKPRYGSKNRYCLAYNLSTATNYAENAPETEENGPYGQFSAISMTLFRITNLTAPKTAKILNKGFQPTTHKLLARHTPSLATHPYGTIRGSRLTPDVGPITIK